MRDVRRLAYVLALAGLGAAVALIAHAGLRTVLVVLAAAGWPLLWLVPLHVVPLALDSMAWRVLLAPRDPQHRARAPVLLAVASVREAVDRLLPVAGVGGQLVGIRIVTQRGLPASSVAASTLTELVLTLLNVVLFAALCLALLAAWSEGKASVGAISMGVLLALPIPLAGLWLINEGRLAGWLARLAGRLSRGAAGTPSWVASIPRLEAELAALAGRRRRLAFAMLLQLLGMIAGAGEIWLALRLLGHPVAVVPATIMESLVLFTRNLAFAVPAALGVQEASIVFIGAALGLSPELALGLALAKRMREVLFGVPALAGWQLWESVSGLQRFALRPKQDRLASKVAQLSVSAGTSGLEGAPPAGERS